MAEKEKLEDVLGEYDAKGTIVREPKVCAVTGRQLTPTSPTVKARLSAGSPYFYRTIASAQMTEARRNALKALVPATPKAAKADKTEA